MPTTDRDARRRELNKLTKTQLARICARGVRTPDGGISYIEGGAHPLSAWRKDEIADSILRAEYGPLPSETAGPDWQTMTAGQFDTSTPDVQLGLFAAPDATGTPDMFNGGLL